MRRPETKTGRRDGDGKSKGQGRGEKDAPPGSKNGAARRGWPRRLVGYAGRRLAARAAENEGADTTESRPRQSGSALDLNLRVEATTRTPSAERKALPRRFIVEAEASTYPRQRHSQWRQRVSPLRCLAVASQPRSK
jgi:hypothetical protein